MKIIDEHYLLFKLKFSIEYIINSIISQKKSQSLKYIANLSSLENFPNVIKFFRYFFLKNCSFIIHPILFFLPKKKKILMFFCKFILLFSNFYLNNMIENISIYKEILCYEKRKVKINKVFFFFHDKKKRIFFHCTFPIFSNEKFFKKKKVCDCTFDVKLKIKIEISKKKVFIGRFEQNTSTFSLISIQKQQVKNYSESENPCLMDVSSFCEEIIRDNKMRGKNFIVLISKNKFIDKKKQLYCHFPIGKISDGFYAYLFNFGPKSINYQALYRKNIDKISESRLFYGSKNKLRSIKKHNVLSIRNLVSSIVMLSFRYYSKKIHLKAGIFLNLQSLGFICRKRFLASSNIIFSIKNFFFIICKSLLDWTYHMMREHYQFQKDTGISHFFLKKNSYFLEEIKCVFQQFYKKMNIISKKFHWKENRTRKKSYLLKSSEKIWNEKSSFSEFYGNIYSKRFQKKKFDFNFKTEFGRNWIFCVQSLLINHIHKKKFHRKFISVFIFVGFSCVFPKFFSEIYNIKGWGNSQFDYSIFRFKEFKLEETKISQKEVFMSFVKEKKKMFRLMFQKAQR